MTDAAPADANKNSRLLVACMIVPSGGGPRPNDAVCRHSITLVLARLEPKPELMSPLGLASRRTDTSPFVQQFLALVKKAQSSAPPVNGTMPVQRAALGQNLPCANNSSTPALPPISRQKGGRRLECSSSGSAGKYEAAPHALSTATPSAARTPSPCGKTNSGLISAMIRRSPSCAAICEKPTIAAASASTSAFARPR